MKHLLIFLVVTPVLGILFAYTKANIYSFWIGFLLCLMAEFMVFVVYCAVKIHKTHRDAFSLKLQSPTLEFQDEYPMPKLHIAKQIYFNRFTEQARLTSKRESVQQPQFQVDVQEINFQQVKVRYKSRIQKYLEQIRNQYNCLSYFNQALIQFGNRMKLVGEKSLIFYGTSYQFTKKEIYFVNQMFQPQLQYEEKKALFKELRIALKRPKSNNQGVQSSSKGAEDLQNIVLPTWKAFFTSMANVGQQFRQIEGMKRANCEYLELIHRKILQDYEIIEKQISISNKTVKKIKSNLEDLRREHQKMQKYQTTGQNTPGFQGFDNTQIIYWFKKQYFDFTGLDHRIKRQQQSYKNLCQEIIYYQAKLASFYQKQKYKYQQTIQTRSYAFLDAYRITLEESLKHIREAFNQSGYDYEIQPGPPRVKELAKLKNINEIVANQHLYQQQYFQRVDHYLNKIGTFRDNLQQIDIFLNKFRSVFAEFKRNLYLEEQHTQIFQKDGVKEKRAVIFDPLIKQLTQQLVRILKIINNLQRVNLQVLQVNSDSLDQTSVQIKDLCAKARGITSELTYSQGPLKERYRLTRQQLNQIYRQIQQKISIVRQFQKILLLHSNRIKKVLICSVTTFVATQKKWVMSYIDYDMALKKQLNQSDMDDPNNNEQEPAREDKPAETLQLNLENVNSMETGLLLCEEYRMLLNRFFFVAFTEWSKSQVFRSIITEEIYIALNEDISQSFSEIIIEDFQATGLPPEINWVKQLKSEEGEFILDFNLAFRGRIIVKLSTNLHVRVTTIPVEFQLRISQFYATIRLCFIHNQMGSSWVSFVGEPVIKIDAKPKIGNYSLDGVANLLQTAITNKLKKMIYPIKKKLMIPLYRKDESYDIIRRRYQSMAV